VDLQPGEKVIYEGHPSWRAILGFYLMGILIAAIVGIAVALVDETATGVVVAVVIVAIAVLAGFVKRVATTYTITDRRLNIKRGIVSRNVQEGRLERVQNANFNQGVYERLMQIGDVQFDTAGADESNFVFAGVAQPEVVVEQVDRATRAGGKAGDTGLEGEGEAR
jgi:uncharacterized membrane protein YdbT with pleckstrin-like domain